MSSEELAHWPALNSEAVLIAPAAVRMLDLEDPLGDYLQLPQARDGGSYRSLLAIARLDGHPLGSAVIGVDRHGRVSRELIEFEFHLQIEPALSEALAGRFLLPNSPPGTTRCNGDGRQAKSRTRRVPVSVVVTTCCNPLPLERCLGSILACDYDDLEVIVVENRPGSQATRQMLAAVYGDDSRVRYVEEPIRGLSNARNAGLAVADGDVVAFTDDDVMVDSAWVERSAEAFAREDDIACVTGLILPIELETETQVLVEKFSVFCKGYRPHTFRLEDGDSHPYLLYTPGMIGSGANTVLRSDVARQLGGFDPTLGAGTPVGGREELDLYVRLLRAGHAIAYEPGAIVWHTHRDGFRQLRRQAYRYGVGLGARLARQVVEGPERRELLRAVPAGIHYALDPASMKNAGKKIGYPRHLDWLEYLGVVAGPAAYVASVLVALYRGQALKWRKTSTTKLRCVKPLALSNNTLVDIVEVGHQPVWRERLCPVGHERAHALEPLERVVVATALAACVAAPPFVALGVAPGLRFAAVLALFCLAPGAALIATLRGRAEFGLVLGASLGSIAVLAQSMLWLGAWQPKPFLYGLSVVCLPPLWTRFDWSHQRRRLAPLKRLRAAAANVPSAVLLHGVLLTGAMAAWLASLAGAQVGRMAGLGLLDAMPPTFFLAFAIVLFGFAVAVISDELHPVVLGLYVLVSILILFGTTALLYDEPRYPWIYKHLGVIDLISTTGAAHRGVDVYNNWPAFFAVNAWLSKVTGIAPIAYAGWAQVVFNVANVAVVRFAVRGLTRDERLLWIAGFFFVLGNWVGQDMLAPQAFAFVISVCVLGLCLRGRHHEWQPRASIGRRLLATGACADDVEAGPLRPAAALTVGAVCYLAVVISHQLSPAFVILSVMLLWLFTRRVPLWIIPLMVAVEAGWVYLAWPYLKYHFSLIEAGIPGAGATGRDLASSLPGAVLSFYSPAAVMGIIVLLAGIGMTRRLRAGRRDVTAACLIAAPFLGFALQVYGGEGFYRAYLFALPWFAFFAAAACSRDPVRYSARSGLVRLTAAIFAVGGFLLFAAFGEELANRITPDEVSAESWMESHAPRGSVGLYLAPEVPTRLSARYAILGLGDSPSLLERPAFWGHRLGASDVTRLIGVVERIKASEVYFMMSRRQADYGRLNGLLPDGSLAAFTHALESSADFRLVYRRSTAWVFEYQPPALSTR